MNISKLFYLFIIYFFSFLSLASPCHNEFLKKQDKKSFIANNSKGLLNSEIFKANDIRGVFLKDFDFLFPKKLGQAIVALSKNQFSTPRPKILIAHDARTSSPSLAKVLSRSLIKEGADVTNIGLAPTPLAYFLIRHYNYTAAAIVTASHNPKEYNGFKIVFNSKFKRYNVTADLKKIILQGNFSTKTKRQGRKISIDPYSPYIKSLKEEFKDLKFNSFVVDAGNGASGLLIKKVFDALNLNPHYLFMEPDGTFPNHHPDPMVESNLKTLKKRVIESQSDFGVAFDGDGDRLGIVTSNGKFVRSDEFAYMFLPSLLRDPKASKNFVSDVKVSNWYYEKVGELNAQITMVPSGYTFLKREMVKQNASLAMELSGHIMFNDRPHRGFDDALYNLLRFIELIEKEGKSVIEDSLKKVRDVKTKEIRLPMPIEDSKRAVQKLKDYLKQKEEAYVDMDGVRVTRGKTWALVRHSNTENILMMLVQAPKKESILELISEFSKVMNISVPKENPSQ